MTHLYFPGYGLFKIECAKYGTRQYYIKFKETHTFDNQLGDYSYPILALIENPKLIAIREQILQNVHGYSYQEPHKGVVHLFEDEHNFTQEAIRLQQIIDKYLTK